MKKQGSFPMSQEATLAATLETISDAILVLGHDWAMRYLNGNAERLLQVRRDEVVGRNVWDVFPDAVNGIYHRAYHEAVSTGKPVAFEDYYAPLALWLDVRAYPSAEGLTIYFRDIGDRKATEAEIHKLAFYDNLTGLPNRQLLLERLESALRKSHHIERFGAMLFIDLDNFKGINDTRGHHMGDLLLQGVAKRLSTNVQEQDTVARLGGDEFVVLLEDLGATESAVERIASERACKLLQSFQVPFNIAGVEQYSTPSIGVAIFGREEIESEDVLKRADLAMYQVKTSGRNGVSLFEPSMQDRVSARAQLETDLRLALHNEDFELYYQPQLDIENRVIGVEALLRWRHPQRGMISPMEFIPVAEETGMIRRLGRWVLEQACMLLERWSHDRRTADLKMSVNVSSVQFHQAHFVEEVLDVLRRTGARADRLRLELTENMLLTDVEGTAGKMQGLRDMGVTLALDDFGTGYSSLSWLHRLPLDQLKIDRSFIGKDNHSVAIVRMIIALGKALNMSVMAEGVETQQQRAFITAEGCHAYQGYLFSKPVSEEQLAELLSS
jgi:diguanylate cyclase (GGDEF)-like protein/PAS domain S-box-containing protein